MLDSKLHTLLARLNAYELNRFMVFIRSPYHNQDEKLVKLYSVLIPYYKTGASGQPDRHKIWKKIYPSRQFTNLHFARLLSDLLKKLESFLIIERMKKQQRDNSYQLLDLYTTMKLEKHFTEPYLSARTQLDKQPYRDNEYYLYNFRFHEQHYTYMENKAQRNTEKNLLETMASLDSFYLINKLRYCASILHYKHFLSIKEETILLSEILDHLQQHPPVHIPVANTYYHVLLTFMEPDNEKHFESLKELFFGHLQLMEIYTRRELFIFALNYCIRKINKGKVHYQKEILVLYKYALEHELIYDDGVLSQWDYKNIVTIGLRNEDHKWTNSFIEDYKSKLPAAEQENAFTFNRARYFFAIRKYDQVLQLLQDVEYSDVFYQLDSKTTLMKTYYELGEYQPLLSLKESFRMLLGRKKLISDQNKANYSNFSRFAIKLYRADVKDQVRLASLKKEIESTANVADRGWILEKLNELIPA